MLTSTSFAIVVIHNQSPWLVLGLEALGDARDGSTGVVVPVERDVHLSPLIVDGLYPLFSNLLGKKECNSDRNNYRCEYLQNRSRKPSLTKVLGDIRQMSFVLKPWSLLNPLDRVPQGIYSVCLQQQRCDLSCTCHARGARLSEEVTQGHEGWPQ